MSAERKRQPKGSPIGGQFAPDGRGEVGDVQLVELGRSTWESRLDDLEEGRYVKPVAVRSASDAGSIKRADFWRQAHATAESGHEKGDYPQMDESHTRQLRTYSSDNASIRMPSHASIHSFARQNGSTFDVPVTASVNGSDVTGWVRCTPREDGSWETSGLGFSDEDEATVAESVNAVLESRRPRTALANAGDLAARRAERRAARASEGVALKQVHSSAFESMGYDGENTLVVKFHDRFRKRDQTWVTNNVYGYEASPEEFAAIQASDSPGKEFHAQVRSQGREALPLERCTSCRRYYRQGGNHQCKPSLHEARPRGAVNADSRTKARTSLRDRWRR